MKTDHRVCAVMKTRIGRMLREHQARIPYPVCACPSPYACARVPLCVCPCPPLCVPVSPDACPFRATNVLRHAPFGRQPSHEGCQMQCAEIFLYHITAVLTSDTLVPGPHTAHCCERRERQERVHAPPIVLHAPCGKSGTDRRCYEQLVLNFGMRLPAKWYWTSPRGMRRSAAGYKLFLSYAPTRSLLQVRF